MRAGLGDVDGRQRAGPLVEPRVRPACGLVDARGRTKAMWIPTWDVDARESGRGLVVSSLHVVEAADVNLKWWVREG